MKALIFALALAIPGFASAHVCDADAQTRADKLFRLHYADDSSAELENYSIDEEATLRAPIKSPNGKMRYDVLELNGHIGKMGVYRMRFIYAVLSGECVLMGQEVLDMSSL